MSEPRLLHLTNKKCGHTVAVCETVLDFYEEQGGLPCPTCDPGYKFEDEGVYPASTVDGLTGLMCESCHIHFCHPEEKDAATDIEDLIGELYDLNIDQPEQLRKRIESLDTAVIASVFMNCWKELQADLERYFMSDDYRYLYVSEGVEVFTFVAHDQYSNLDDNRSLVLALEAELDKRQLSQKPEPFQQAAEQA